MIKVIALDPGRTTGWARGLIDGEGYMRVQCSEWAFTHLSLYQWLIGEKMDYLVYEKFDFRKSRQGVDLYPVEMIGIIRLFGETSNILLFNQSPSTGKSFYTDEKLREANVYERGLQHGRDALRHLLQWYNFGYGYQFNKLGFGP